MPQDYVSLNMNGVDLVCRRGPNPLIVLTGEVVPRLVRYYHEITAHAEGINRLEATLCRHYWHPQLRHEIRRQIERCHTCQLVKRRAPQVGQLSAREESLLPFEEVHVDTIGPWKISCGKKQEATFQAHTAIEPVTRLVEIRRITQNTSQEAANAFESCWLSRFPRPLRCVHDHGSEFMGFEFQALLSNAGVRTRPVSSHNPQSNGLIESVHRTIGQVIRTVVQNQPPKSMAEAEILFGKAIDTAVFATRCASHHALNGASPGSMAFRRDMLLNIPFVADLLTLKDLKQHRVDTRLLEANAKRSQHDYRVGDRVLKRRVITPGTKLDLTYDGPYRILQVHTNGTVSLELRSND